MYCMALEAKLSCIHGRNVVSSKYCMERVEFLTFCQKKSHLFKQQKKKKFLHAPTHTHHTRSLYKLYLLKRTCKNFHGGSTSQKWGYRSQREQESISVLSLWLYNTELQNVLVLYQCREWERTDIVATRHRRKILFYACRKNAPFANFCTGPHHNKLYCRNVPMK